MCKILFLENTKYFYRMYLCYFLIISKNLLLKAVCFIDLLRPLVPKCETCLVPSIVTSILATVDISTGKSMIERTKVPLGVAAESKLSLQGLK